MPILWSLVIVTGLLILVYLMIAGVPHLQVEQQVAGGVPRTVLPMLGGFFTAAGIAGYLTMDSSRFQGGVRAGLIGVIAIVTALVTRWIIIKAFTEPPPDPEDDPRYRYQGHVGRLTSAIKAGRPGRVVFDADGQRFDLVAHSIDAEPVDEGVEVVIERIDDQVATVEPWAAVEERL